MKDRRRLGLVNSKFQFQFCLILGFPVALTIFSVFVATLYWFTTLVLKDTLSEQIYHEEWLKLVIILAVCFLFLIVVLSYYIFRVSHRLAGPLIAVERYLNAVKDQQKTGPLTMRDGDELQVLADEINKASKNNPKFFQ